MKKFACNSQFCWTLALLVTLGLCGASARAANINWTGASSVNWSDTGNWQGGAVPSNSDVAVFNFGAYPFQPTVNTAQAVLGIQVTANSSPIIISPGNTLTIGASGIDLSAAVSNLTLNAASSLGAAQTWTVVAGRTLTVNGGVANSTVLLTVAGAGNTTITGVVGNGSGGLTVTATGTVTLSGQSNFSGGTLVSAAAVLVLAADSTPNTVGATVTSGPLGTGALTLGAGTFQAGGAPGTRTVANNIILTATVISAGSQNLTLNGNFTNSGGNRQLSVNNTGILTINGSVFLSEALATGRTFTFDSGSAAGNNTLVVNGVIANASGGAGTAGGLNIQPNFLGDSMAINGANTYTGNTGCGGNDLGRVLVGSDTAFGVGGTLSLNKTALQPTANRTIANPYSIVNSPNSIEGNGGFTMTLSGSGTNSANNWTLLNNNNALLSLSGTNIFLSETTATARTLTLGGSGNITVSSIIANANGAGLAGGLTYTGNATLTLAGANTYSGLTTISRGTVKVTGSLNGTTGTPLTINGTSAFTVQEAAGINQGMGALTLTAGEATITSVYAGSGNSALTFSSLAARSAGAVGNFIISGGTNGTTNKIVLTGQTANTFLNQGLFFSDGGANSPGFVWYDTGLFVRAINYGGDGATTATNTGGTTAASVAHLQVTGNITAQATGTFTTVKIVGASTFTPAAASTITVSGILKSGNVAGPTISGGTALTTPASTELVIRTDGASDTLTINQPVTNATATSMTKAGLGSLTYGALAVNTYTAGNALDAGKLIITQDNNAGTAASAIAMNGGSYGSASAAVITNTHVITVGVGGGTFNFTGNQLYLHTSNTLVGSGPLLVTGAGAVAGNLAPTPLKRILV